MTILLATHRRATEIDRLIDELRRRGSEFFRVNMAVSEDGCSVGVTSTGDAEIVFASDQGPVRGVEVRAAWYHQPPIATVPERLTGTRAGKGAIFTSHTNVWLAALALLECTWLNSPAAVERSANKVMQLFMAAEAHLHVPETIAGNIPDKVREHFDGQETVAKNLASLHQAWGERSDLSFLTRSIRVENLADSQISACPVLYQRKLQPWREHRIVIVGEQHFVVTINQESRSEYVDVRSTPEALRQFYPSEIDSSTIAGLHRLLKAYSLRYCSADFLETSDGEVYFLDLNSCGAWWWVDDLYAGRITEALADTLEADVSASH